MKFAIVGCGRIAKRHSDLLGEGQIEGAELVAVADQHIDRAKAVGEAKNVPAYADMHDKIFSIYMNDFIIFEKFFVIK